MANGRILWVTASRAHAHWHAGPTHAHAARVWPRTLDVYFCAPLKENDEPAST